MVDLSRRLLTLFLCFFVFTESDIAMSSAKTKFEWTASDSAPKNFSMKIISGNLRYQGDPSGAGLYVPSGGQIDHGWGVGGSTHVTGPALKPLPDKLDITFFSYLEDQFYQGSFDLPYDEILKFFNEQDAKPKTLNADGKGIPVRFEIIVGVAPGGTVAVWAIADGGKEVFFGKAKKVELDFGKAFRIPITSKTERTNYVNESLEDETPPEILTTLRKTGIPFDKWANYRIRYNWVPTFVGKPPLDYVAVGFYNGEGLRYSLPLEKSFATSPHPVPDSIDFRYIAPGQNDQYPYEILFNEPEILDAFKKLSAKQLPLKLEIDPKYPQNNTRIRLHNGKESIEIKKFTVK